MKLSDNREYEKLINQISSIFERGRQKALQAVNVQLLETYWEIGRHIVEFEQEGESRAEYGKSLINKLAEDLGGLQGRGFSRSNLIYMRLLYLEYPISEKPSHLLSWSHYVELLKINNKEERSFYEKQSIIESWSIPELKRQKKASLYLRLAASKDKKGIMHLAKEGQSVSKPEHIIRDPYVLDFLKIPELHQYSETELEGRIIEHLQYFLLELGKGFAFVGRQYRITIGNRHHYVDLVFYHRILKCFVLIDLKREDAGYEDIGQMNMYLGYFENEENTEGDNPPIGMVLARGKDDLLIKYAMHNVSSQLFVSRYQLYLPNEDELRAVIEETINE